MLDSLAHGVVAFLYALGLAMTLLCVMGFTAQIPLSAVICLVLTAVCTVASLNKWSMIALLGLLTASGGVWLTMMGGLTILTDVLRAVTLHMTGLTTALPLFAQETVMLLSVVCTLGAFLLTHRSAGGYPALMVLLLAVLLLWLGDKPMAMVYMLPAVAATVALLIHTAHVILPLRRILPLAAVLAALAYLIVPAQGVSIAPLKNAADELRQTIFDYLFFTEPRNVFTLASEGYYSQGQNQLGGPATPDDEPVMMVATPKRTYLRGAVKDEYTGRAWIDTRAGRRYLWVSPRWRSERTQLFDALLPGGALGADEGLMAVSQVSVRMVDEGSASTMFVPQRIRDLQPGGDMVPYFNASSEVFATRDLQAGDTYTVSAPLMLGGEAGLGTLVTACAASEDPAWESIRQEYTRLPGHFQQELYTLTESVVADAKTPYDKAYALQTYLSRTYRYALDVEVIPANVDFVSYFLLKSKEGYCTYFASAMTVMCRMAGLPARYVEGYLAEPEENGVAYVTGMNGHAWTEVYFEGFGWLTFDATPVLSNGRSPSSQQQDEPQQEPEPSPPPQENPPEDTEEPEDTPEPETPPEEQTDTDDPTENRQPSALWLLWLLLLLALIAAVRILLTQPARLAARETAELGRWMVWTQAMHDALNLRHLRRKPSESPIAYMRRLDQTHRLGTELTPIGECEALVFYGRLDPQPEETRMSSQAYACLTAAMPWYRKVQLAAVRAFIPLKKRDFTR
ncbi:MAG: transglutaminase domain-containing protein [Clostridia bacterium]|nr:transglutaminase domain-containing protein [Clostridia bacterium]